MTVDRRQFLSLAALAGIGAAVPLGGAGAQSAIKTSARIVIIGAGAAGTALANRLVRRLDGADIAILDPREQHI